MFYVGVLEVVGILLLLTILVRAVVAGMFRKYVAFYFYISFVLACAGVQFWLKLSYGVTSRPYYYAYHLPNILSSVLLVWILLDVYTRFFGNSKSSWSKVTWPAILVVMMALMAGLRVLSIPTADPFYRYQAVALPIQVVLGLWVFQRLTSVYLPVELGRNVTGILLGVALIVGGQTVNFTSYLFLGESFRVFSFFVQFGYFLALAVFCSSLWDYQPAKRLQHPSQLQIANFDQKLQRVVKALLLKK